MTWRPALRLARREALRAKGRSTLIVAMVALPVLGIGAADLMYRSAELDPDERVTRELGQAQARLTLLGAGSTIVQSPDPDREGATVDSPVSGPPGGLPRTPDGYRALISREGELPFQTAAGEAPFFVEEVLVGDPAFRGKYKLLSGRAPRTRDEIAVTGEALERLGAGVGGEARLAGSARRLRVVGVVESPGSAPATIWARPGSLLPPDRVAMQPPSVYLAGAKPVTWEDVLQLNQRGIVVYSRSVVLDPPPRSSVAYYTRGFSSREAEIAAITTVLAIALVVTLSMLEVVLLAGAAFAVGARRQARALGLVTAAGGEPRDVRLVVLAGGLVLGVTGALVGLALAFVVSAAAMPLLTRFADVDFGRYDVRPLELFGAFLVGLVAALLAAVLPARTAARRDPVEALSGRRGQVKTPKKVPAVGLGLVVVGVGAAAFGSVLALSNAAGVNPAAGTSALVAAGLVAGGAVLTQLGLIVCSPAIVGLAGRFARRLPLTMRLALTDAARHRGRTAPAVSAVLAAVTGATAIALIAASFDDRDRRGYVPSWPDGMAGITLEEFRLGPDGIGSTTLANPDRALAAVAGDLPAFGAHRVRSERACHDPEGCPSASLILPPEQQCPAFAGAEGRPDPADPRCDLGAGFGASALPPTPIGDAELVRVLAGRSRDGVAETLGRGGIVLFDKRYEVNGKATLEIAGKDGSLAGRVKLPATVIDVPNPPVLAVYGETAARRLGLRPGTTHLLLDFREPPTTAEEDAARGSLRSAGLPSFLTVERGYESDYGGGLLALVLGAAIITLGAAGIATGLAQADARADYATLAAVGATPTMRRGLAGAQAVAVAGLGALLGALAGFVPGMAFIGAVESLDLVVPWFTLAQLVIGIPLLAALSAWLLTRSHLPVERRAAA